MNTFDPYSANKGTYDRSTHPPQPTSTPSPLSSLNQSQIQFFLDLGFTTGLLKTLFQLKSSYFHRCLIIDNGSNMTIKDSHRLLIRNGSGDNSGSIDRISGVSRWEELLDCIGKQTWFSSNLDIPMRCALLNQPLSNVGRQYFTMGEKDTPDQILNQQQEIQKVAQIMKSIQPHGPTNLTKQLSIIQRYISSIAPELQSKNQKIVLILATQGLPTNDMGETNPQITQEFVSMLKSFQSLPVSLSIRLCTDDEKVVDFYNQINDADDSPYDVIDDYFGESLEVYLKNPWLTYGLSLHRLRELGFHGHVLDIIDEQLLTLDELHDFCYVLFDAAQGSIPHPKTNWDGFLNAISKLMKREKQQWNPVSRKFTPWINIIQLKQIYATRTPEHTIYSQQRVHPSNIPPAPQVPHNQNTKPSPMQPPQTNHTSPVTQPAPQQMQKPLSPSEPTSDESVKKMILLSWALQPPSYQSLKQLPELLGSLQNVLPPAFGIKEHPYFKKWKVLCTHGLESGGNAVVKRAHRKAKFLLHPDKLPNDLTERQQFVCKLIWDILADAWEVYAKD